jgi:hypothetical protein
VAAVIHTFFDLSGLMNRAFFINAVNRDDFLDFPTFRDAPSHLFNDRLYFIWAVLAHFPSFGLHEGHALSKKSHFTRPLCWQAWPKRRHSLQGKAALLA